MKKLDLGERVQNEIGKAIRADIRERLPKDFYGLFYETMQNITAKFYWYDKYELRRSVLIEIDKSFRKRVSEEDGWELSHIWNITCKQWQDSVHERNSFNEHSMFDK